MIDGPFAPISKVPPDVEVGARRQGFAGSGTVTQIRSHLRLVLLSSLTSGCPIQLSTNSALVMAAPVTKDAEFTYVTGRKKNKKGKGKEITPRALVDLLEETRDALQSSSSWSALVGIIAWRLLFSI